MADTSTKEPTTEERLVALMEASEQRAAEREQREHNDKVRAWALAVAAQEAAAATDNTRSEDLKTPTEQPEETRISVGRNPLEQRGFTRADAEVAFMLGEGARRMSRPTEIKWSEDFMNFYNAKVRDARDIHIVGDEGNYVRAMDSQESGFGQQLIGAQYVSELWSAARNEDSIVERIREIPMTAPTTNVPIDGDLPEMFLAAESTTQDASAYATSKTPSNRATLTAKKFTIQQIWSGELNEDSIVAFTPFLREQLARSTAFHMGSAFYNGDTTNSGTGNINLDDADPADTKHYLAFDGIRKSWLVTDSLGKDMNGALDVAEIFRARGKLNGAADDIDAGATSPNWGRVASDLILVCDFDTLMALSNSSDFVSVEKYGAQATVVTGELGRAYGIPVICPSYAAKTDTDGKLVDNPATNVKGQLTIFNPRGFLAGGRSDVALYFDRVQRTDQFLVELYVRKAFTRFGANVAAGVYNITVA